MSISIDKYGVLVARAVKAELERQGKTSAHIADALNTTEIRICRRLDASVPFDLNEIEAVAQVLAVQLDEILSPSKLTNDDCKKEGME